jgi:DNA invertase Pin-like site-specific DNA recombinase
MMKTGYARVSTADQDLTIQLAKLTSAGCERVFQEKRSGSLYERPALLACLDWVREGDILVVTKLDRLARSMAHLCAMLQTLKDKGVGFEVLDQPLETTTPLGQLLFHILGAIAEFEQAIRRERQLEGIAQARKEGRSLGGRAHALGPEQVALLQHLRRQGVPVSALSHQFKLGRTALYRYLAGVTPDQESG